MRNLCASESTLARAERPLVVEQSDNGTLEQALPRELVPLFHCSTVPLFQGCKVPRFRAALQASNLLRCDAAERRQHQRQDAEYGDGVRRPQELAGHEPHGQASEWVQPLTLRV